MPGVSIGINVPVYPQLVRVPGYPVYYAPQLQTNFFFYDGLYWVYQDDDWYASDWYDGPWGQVAPEAVPLFVLRIPVRYYRSPPTYFRGWRADAPPHWGDHWGDDWQQRRQGWDRWNRHAVPAPAPLPTYQRPYSAERYPRPEQQQSLRERYYRHQPREGVVRQHLQAQPALQAPSPREWREPREWRDPRDAAPPRRDQRGERDQRDQRDQRGEREQRDSREPRDARSSPMVAPQPRQPEAAPERDRGPGKGQQHQPNRQEQGKPDQGKKEQGRGRDNDDDRGRDRNR